MATGRRGKPTSKKDRISPSRFAERLEHEATCEADHQSD
jgi:hypothetical protein